MIHFRRPLFEDLIGYLENGNLTEPEDALNKWFSSPTELLNKYKFFSALEDLYAFSDSTYNDGTNVFDIHKVYIITTQDYYLTENIFSDHTSLLEDVKFFVFPLLGLTSNNYCKGQFIYQLNIDYHSGYDIYGLLSEEISIILLKHYLKDKPRPLILTNSWPELGITEQKMYIEFKDSIPINDKNAIISRIKQIYHVKYLGILGCC